MWISDTNHLPNNIEYRSEVEAMRVHEIQIYKDLEPQYVQEIALKAGRFRSDINIKFEQQDIRLDAKSILGMMLLPFRSGTRVTIQTKGSDEEEAIAMMCDLLEVKNREGQPQVPPSGGS
jgi:phosphocarrier protein HPr